MLVVPLTSAHVACHDVNVKLSVIEVISILRNDQTGKWYCEGGVG